MSSIVADGVFGPESVDRGVARLPGEGLDGADFDARDSELGVDSVDTLVADERPSVRNIKRSNLPLYAGVGAVAMLLGIGYLVMRPHHIHRTLAANHVAIAPVPLMATPTPLAPAASLANVPVKTQPQTVVHPKYVPQPPSAQLTELEALQPSNNQPLAGTVNASPPAHPTQKISAPRPQLPAKPVVLRDVSPVAAPHPTTPNAPQPTTSGSPSQSPSLAASRNQTVLTPAAQKPAAPAPVKSSVTLPTEAPSAPVLATPATTPSPVSPALPATLAAAQAGAMSPAQEIGLYQLVTQLAALVRADEIKDAVIAGQVQQLTAVTTGKMADYDRRLSMVEAQLAVSGAEQAGTGQSVVSAIGVSPTIASPAPPAVPVAAASPVPAAIPSETATAPAAAQPVTNAATAVVQYHVQAASPGLAMLSAVGSDSPPLQVQVGDMIPGYGKVISVVQQGNSWIVETQGGNIQ